MAKGLKQSDFLKKFSLTKEDVLSDYRICLESRETSDSGRKEVFAGRAKFGLFGEGKEVPQVALARYFQNGDIRSGYYRDQTLMFAIGCMTPKHLFAQLYAHANIDKEPISGGRLMTGHFGHSILNEDGTWRDLTKQKNSTTDVSPTASQMPRLLGLAYASKLYRENSALKSPNNFSIKGNEIAFGTIGNASTSEGMFFETINAAGVLQVPMHVSIWDDEYGISVPSELQTTKGDIGAVLQGFQRDEKSNGFDIHVVKGWDYPALIEAYEKSTKTCREDHIPIVVHVTELTQPGGHSTSGSHTRYKSKERIAWEKEHDCIKKMREWIIESDIASDDELKSIEKEVKSHIRKIRKEAWNEMNEEFQGEKAQVETLLEQLISETQNIEVKKIKDTLNSHPIIIRSHVVKAAKQAIHASIRDKQAQSRTDLIEWHEKSKIKNHERYSSHLWNEKADAVYHVPEVPIEYSDNPEIIDGHKILNHFFDKALAQDERIFCFGEDVGKIGDVNQGFAGLQQKYNDLRVTDTGIRECTILGQAIGAALRGLKPIAEIQYLDYIMYAIQIMSDDLATMQYRSYGQQKAPVIVRTRGHRLEGVWHSGSPLGIILNCLRGMYVCVPRNMTQAAGMYNTLLKSGDPGLVIECLNGYRLKEPLPSNIGDYTIPLGKVEFLREGTDVTVVTYGAMCRICLDAAEKLEQLGISVEIIDVQTLVPFDIEGKIVESIKKTNRVLFADEDVPGGSSAFMLQQVVEKENGYHYLDSKPKTLHSWAHRPAYATDGDYFSKPQPEDVVDYVYDIMNEVDPDRFPPLYDTYAPVTDESLLTREAITK